jgi:hypothetical protein
VDGEIVEDRSQGEPVKIIIVPVRFRRGWRIS